MKTMKLENIAKNLLMARDAYRSADAYPDEWEDAKKESKMLKKTAEQIEYLCALEKAIEEYDKNPYCGCFEAPEQEEPDIDPEKQEKYLNGAYVFLDDGYAEPAEDYYDLKKCTKAIEAAEEEIKRIPYLKYRVKEIRKEIKEKHDEPCLIPANKDSKEKDEEPDIDI